MDGGASPHAAKGKTKKRKMSMSEGHDKVKEMHKRRASQSEGNV